MNLSMNVIANQTLLFDGLLVLPGQFANCPDYVQSPTWLTSTQMAHVLQEMTVESGSGDIYARRCAS